MRETPNLKKSECCAIWASYTEIFLQQILGLLNKVFLWLNFLEILGSKLNILKQGLLVLDFDNCNEISLIKLTV